MLVAHGDDGFPAGGRVEFPRGGPVSRRGPAGGGTGGQRTHTETTRQRLPPPGQVSPGLNIKALEPPAHPANASPV